MRAASKSSRLRAAPWGVLRLAGCGSEVAPGDLQQGGWHRGGERAVRRANGVAEFALVVGDGGDAGVAGALEVEVVLDAVLDDVADPFVDASADALEAPDLCGFGESVLVELLHAGG